jgi:hypothetical protein
MGRRATAISASLSLRLANRIVPGQSAIVHGLVSPREAVMSNPFRCEGDRNLLIVLAF